MRSRIISCLLAAMYAACTDPAPPPMTGGSEPGGDQTGAEITAWAGGSVSFGSEVMLRVPAGSLARDTTIRIARLPSLPDAPADGFVSFGQGYELSPHGTAFSLAQPARIAVTLDRQALAARGLLPHTAQLFYFDEAARRYVNVAGTVDASGALVASIEHFSKYVVMAQAAAPGAPGPVVAMQAPVPDPIRAGSPIYLRATVLPSPGTAIAAVRVFYRKLQPSAQMFQTAVMTPDSSPVTPGANTYGFVLPASTLAAGDLGMGDDLEYYAEATDTLGATRSLSSSPVKVDVTRSYAPGTLATTPATLDISAGFEKWLPVMATDNAPGPYQIVPEAVSVTSCLSPASPIGTAVDERAAGVHFRALAACVGTLSIGAGTETKTVPVTVRSGQLAAISVFQFERMGGTEVRTLFDGTFQLSEGHTLELDAQGNDGFGNTMNVNVAWQADANLGTIDAGGQLYTLDGAGFGKVTASVGGLGGVSAVQWFNTVPRSWAPKSGALNIADPVTWAPTQAQPVTRPRNRAIRLLNDSVLLTDRLQPLIYRPSTGIWSTAALMQNRAEHAASLLPSGRVLVTGGLGVTAEVYDPLTNVWTPTTPMVASRIGHQQILLPNGKTLVIGGAVTTPATALATAETYDPVIDAWVAGAPMKVARRDHAVSLLSRSRVLVTGGQNAVVQAAAETFDLATGLWSDAAPMGVARRDHTQTVLANGKVLVAGGTGPTVALSSAEIYDPSTNVWTATLTAMTVARSGHTATLLPDGRVLVTGGETAASAEIYDPSTNGWTAILPMSAARSGHTATLLSSGRVLISGLVAAPADLYLPSQLPPQPQLAASDTVPYVTWHEPNAFANRVYVKQWNGTAWAPVGSSFVNDTDREASFPRVAVNPTTGFPYVAWQEQSATAGTVIQVKRWTGLAWVQDALGNLNVDASRAASAPAIAFSDNTPYIAWQEATGSASQIFVRRWNGSAWTQLGGSLNRDPTQRAEAPAIAIVGATPYVAWQETSTGAQHVHVSHWDGSAWVADGANLNLDPAGSATAPSIALQGTVPYVSWRETVGTNVGTNTQLSVAHWNGAAWIADGPNPAIDPTRPVGAPEIALFNGTPHLAWRETLGNGFSQIVIKHRRGAAWTQNGASLNANIGRDAFQPSLTFVGASPFASWAESNGPSYSVFVKALE